jgi:hypothetical protein
MSSKMNGNTDLAIPAFLKGSAKTKPTPAKPTPAKPSAVKPTPATKPTKAPTTKPLSAKGQAQLRGGVKVTDKVAAPAKPAPAAKPAKPAKPVGELLKAVKAHAKHFAHKNGWDLLLLWSDADLSKELAGLTSKSAAVAKMRKVAQGLNKQRPKDQPAPARA